MITESGGQKMATKVDYWTCDVCGAAYEKNQDASECEDSHVDVSTLSIQGESEKGSYRNWPKRITVGSSADADQLATYHLVGFRDA